MDLRRPQDRMVQLGRQAKPSNAFLDLPSRQRVAECNKPLETISARVERHFGDVGVAEVNAAQELLALMETQSKEREVKEKLMESVEMARKRAVNAVKKLRMERKNCRAEEEVRREKKNRAQKYSEEVLRRNASAAAQSKETDAAKQSEDSPKQDANGKVRIIREVPYASKSPEQEILAISTTPNEMGIELCAAGSIAVHQNGDNEQEALDSEPPCSDANGFMSDEQDNSDGIDVQEDPGIAPPQCPSEHFHSPIDENSCRKQEEQQTHHCHHSHDSDNAEESPTNPAKDDVHVKSNQFPSATRLHLKTYDPAHARRLLQSHARQYREEPEISVLGVKPGPSELQNGCSGATNGILKGSRDKTTGTAKQMCVDSSQHIVNRWKVVNPFQDERAVSCPSLKGSNQGCQKLADSLLSNSTVLYMLQQKVADLGVKLPRLCNCHNLSHFDQNYTRHCCINCPLYRNIDSQERLLKSLLRNYMEL